ncbi:MAG: carbon-nitrogen hydrolase family protein, partial [Candidatus Micrarchaeota archaeon]
MRVALAQMEIVQGDPDANLRKISSLIRRAKARKADVAVFPEYALTGSVRGREHLIAEGGTYRKIFSSLAKNHSIDVVCGSFVERSGGKPYNTSCYFERSGKMLGIYRKKNLWHSERGRLARGNGISVFDTRFGKAGIAICWDLANPLIFRKMAESGARIIFVPSFWSDAGISNYSFESRNIDALCFAR